MSVIIKQNYFVTNTLYTAVICSGIISTIAAIVYMCVMLKTQDCFVLKI